MLTFLKNLSILKLIAVFLAFSIVACDDSEPSFKNRTKNAENTTQETTTQENTTQEVATSKVEGQIITSDDGVSQVTVPDNWKVLSDLNDEAIIEVGNTREENYLILLSDPKTDLDYDYTLEEHAELTRGFLEEGVSVNYLSPPKNILINGNFALQYEIKGVISGLDIVYLHTTVETDDYFHQMIAWTLESNYSRNESILQSAINSFQEN